MSANLNTCATLVNIQLAMEQTWADSSKQRDYLAEVTVANAVIDNTTVRVEGLNNPMKDNTVTIYWPEFCSPTTAAVSNNCDAAGTKPGTSCQNYTLTLGREVEFAVSETTYRTIATTFEEAAGAAMLSNMKALDEWVAAQFVTKIISSKGVNAYTAGKGTVAGFVTTIAPAYWNASLFPYLKLVTAKNKFNAPYLINGANLFEAAELAKANSANADGKGAATLFNQMPMYNDLFNIDSVLSGASFLMNKNALSFQHKTYYPNEASGAVGRADGTTGARYSIPSRNIKGLRYDVYYRIACSGSDIVHNWKIVFTGDIFRSPVGCDLNNTGILELLCG